MQKELISKDDLREPYIITKDLAIKEIKDFKNYHKSMLSYVEQLNILDSDDNFQSLVEFGNAISSDVRLKILYFIYQTKSTCFCELESIFKIKKSTLNYHIKLLTRSDLVKTSKKGKLIVIEIGNSFDELIPEKMKKSF